MRLPTAFEFGRPDKDKDGVGPQEQCVRAVVDVLTAEIPDVNSREVGGVAASQIEGLDDNPVRGRKFVIVGLVPETAAELCLPDAAIAQNDELDFARTRRCLRRRPGNGREVRVGSYRPILATGLRQGRRVCASAIELKQLRRQLGQTKHPEVEKARPLVRLLGDPFKCDPFSIRRGGHVSPTLVTSANLIHRRRIVHVRRRRLDAPAEASARGR